MKDRQQGQHYIVTGGGTGIGKATAIRLAVEGAKVSLMARNIDRLQTVVNEIREAGGEAQCFTCDITNQSAVQKSFAQAVETFGPLRGVVANSGVGGANFPGENDRFDIVVQTNVYGTYYTLRAAQEHLIQDGKATHMVVDIILLGSLWRSRLYGVLFFEGCTSWYGSFVCIGTRTSRNPSQCIVSRLGRYRYGMGRFRRHGKRNGDYFSKDKRRYCDESGAIG